jgi:hypothetical protein
MKKYQEKFEVKGIKKRRELRTSEGTGHGATER